MQQPLSSVQFGKRPSYNKAFTPMPTRQTPCTSVQSNCIGGGGLISNYSGPGTTDLPGGTTRSQIPQTNLNLEAYTLTDLRNIFQLPTSFTLDMLKTATENSIQSIRQNEGVTIHDRNSIEKFFKSASSLLSSSLSSASASASGQTELSMSALKAGQVTQLPKHTPYTHTMPSEYYAGHLNPIARRTVDKNLSVNSRFRSNYYATSASDFNYTPPVKFDNILDLRLSSFEAPLTFFNVSKQLGNNFFKVEVPYTDASGNAVIDSLVVEIPSGNYNYDGMVEMLNKQMMFAGGGNQVFSAISFSIDMTDGENGSGRMAVSLAAGNSFGATTFVLDFVSNVHGVLDEGTPLPLKMGWMLGFRNGRYENCANGVYISEGVVDLAGTKYIFFILEDYVKNVNENFFATFADSQLSGNVLARISVPSAQTLTLEPNNSVTPRREYHGPVSISRLGIRLVDEYGRNLDLANMDFSFCLSMTAAYDL